MGKNFIYSVFIVQGCYFVVAGVWPVVNMASFISATGPKQDIWLVQMVGLLSIAIGLTFLQAALRRKNLPMFLAYAASLSFFVMDVVCVANGTIRNIYLIDAVIQGIFMLLLTIFLIRNRAST